MKLFKEKKTFCFDVDGIICKTKKNNYIKSIPIKKNIKFINNLYIKGHHIKIFTARFMGRNNDNVKKAKRDGLKLTKYQLKKWNLKYHKLIMGKPTYDYFIDDKAFTNIKDFLKNIK